MSASTKYPARPFVPLLHLLKIKMSRKNIKLSTRAKFTMAVCHFHLQGSPSHYLLFGPSFEPSHSAWVDSHYTSPYTTELKGGMYPKLLMRALLCRSPSLIRFNAGNLKDVTLPSGVAAACLLWQKPGVYYVHDPHLSQEKASEVGEPEANTQAEATPRDGGKREGERIGQAREKQIGEKGSGWAGLVQGQRKLSNNDLSP